MRKFTKAAAMLCAAAMVIPSASVFAAEDGGASELTEVGTYPISEEPLEFTMFRTNMPNVEDFQTNDFTKYMEDLTNIKFTFEAAARDDRAEHGVQHKYLSRRYHALCTRRSKVGR